MRPDPADASSAARPAGTVSTVRGGSTDARVLAIALLFFTLAAILSLRHGQDFQVFWRAGSRFPSGADLFPVTDGFLQWRYLPATALLFSPLSLLPLGAARLVWFAVLVGCGTGSVALLASSGGARIPARVVALALAVVSRPVLEEFACGQTNLLVLLVVLVALRELDRGGGMGAGVLLALAIAMKITPALLLVDAVLRRQWRVLAGAALGLASLLVASVPFYGLGRAIALHQAWIAQQLRVSASLIPAPANQSVFAAVARLDGPTWLAASLGAGLVVLATCAPRDGRRALLLLATALASPLGWIQNYVFALPAAVRVTLGRHPRLAAALGLALLGVVSDVTGSRLERWVFVHSLPLALGLVLFIAAFGRAREEGRTLDRTTR